MGTWPEHVTDVLGGDLVVALGYRTPAGGVVALPVTTLGAHDPAAGTVGTSTAFGNGRKLTRIERDDRVALLYHAREHGTARAPHTVLVQGRGSFPDHPDPAWFRSVEDAWQDRLVPRKHGRLWDWVGREYYDLRVPITVTVERIVVWSGPDDTDTPEVIGAPLPDGPPAPQRPPANGTGARVPAARYAKRGARARHRVLGWTDADGAVMLRPVEVHQDGDVLVVAAPGLPPGGRRAGLLQHWFEPRLDGQGNAAMTGWLEVQDGEGRYHPHTLAGYALPTLGATAFSLGAGLATKAAHRRLAKAGHIRDGVWQRRAADA